MTSVGLSVNLMAKSGAADAANVAGAASAVWKRLVHASGHDGGSGRSKEKEDGTARKWEDREKLGRY